ncbi:hypothetical protein M422DRAFT_165449, partial [Sphaerobolus stellatus SS14]
LVIVGDKGVGKTSIIKRFVHDEFTNGELSTIGVDICVKSVVINGKRTKNQFWSASGDAKYRKLASAYFRGASGALVVYDVTDRESYIGVKRWIQELRDLGYEHMKIILVGNKVDLNDSRTVSMEEAKVFADENHLTFMETSACTSANIEEVFHELLRGTLRLNFNFIHAYTVTGNLAIVDFHVERSVLSVQVRKDPSSLGAVCSCC